MADWRCFARAFPAGLALEVVGGNGVGGRQVHTLTGHSSGVRSVVFSPNGKRVASGSEDGLVKIWDTETGALVSSLVGSRAVW